MRISTLRFTLVLLAWIACTPSTYGGALRIEEVSADAAWLMHVDVDRLRGSAVWGLLEAALQDNTTYHAKVRELEDVSAAKHPRDLHGVTLYGRDYKEDGVTLHFHSGANVGRILALLKHNPRYRSYTVRNHQVVSWEDQDRQLYGCFYQTDRLVMAWSQNALNRALAVIDGQEPALKSDSPLAAGLRPVDGGTPLAYLACTDVAALRREKLARSPLLARIGRAWIGFSDETGKAVLRGQAETDGPVSAERLRVSVEGLKAMAALGDTDGRDPEARLRAVLAQGVSLTPKGPAVDLDWRVDWKALLLAPVPSANGQASVAPDLKE